MEFVLLTLGITFGICIVIIIVARVTAKSRIKKLNDEPGQEYVRQIQAMFENNVSKPIQQIYMELGISNIEDVFAKMSDNRAWFNSYSLAIADRYYLQHKPIGPIDHNQYKLNLKTNEVLYFRISGTNLYEEKVTRRDITYSGVRWNNEMLRAGTLSLISHEIKNFVIQDFGSLNITNERIIFIGRQKNVVKAINLDDIITYNLFQDGVLVLQPNKNAYLFKFEKYEEPELLQDGLNQFVIVLSRILKNNQDASLDIPEFANFDKDKDNTYQESSETTSSEPASVEDIKERLQEIKNKISKLHEDNIALSEIIKRDNNPG